MQDQISPPMSTKLKHVRIYVQHISMTKHPAFHACTIRDMVTHCDWLHPNRVPSLARSMRAVTCCRFGQTTCIIITRTATPTQMKDKQETHGGASSLSIAPPTPLCAPTMPGEARLFLALKFTIRKPPSALLPLSRNRHTAHLQARKTGVSKAIAMYYSTWNGRIGRAREGEMVERRARAIYQNLFCLDRHRITHMRQVRAFWPILRRMEGEERGDDLS